MGGQRVAFTTGEIIYLRHLQRDQLGLLFPVQVVQTKGAEAGQNELSAQRRSFTAAPQLAPMASRALHTPVLHHWVVAHWLSLVHAAQTLGVGVAGQ